MGTRLERLKKLLAVQEQLKALHETRHAGFLAAAAAAKAEAAELATRFDSDGSLAAVFPEVYHRRIAEALARERTSLELAEKEAARLAATTLRTGMVERAYRDARNREERVREDRERLELIAARGRPQRGK